MKNQTTWQKIKSFLGYKFLELENGLMIEYGLHWDFTGRGDWEVMTYRLMQWNGTKWIKLSHSEHDRHYSRKELIDYLIRESKTVRKNYKKVFYDN